MQIGLWSRMGIGGSLLSIINLNISWTNFNSFYHKQTATITNLQTRHSDYVDSHKSWVY